MSSRELVLPPTSWSDTVRTGAILGIIAVFLALVGMVEAFAKRVIIEGVIAFGPLLVLITFYFSGSLASRRAAWAGLGPAVLHGAVAGLVTAAFVVAYTLLFTVLPGIGSVMVSATAALLQLLTFGQGLGPGSLLVLALGLALGALAAALHFLPGSLRRSLVQSVASVIVVGLLVELIRVTLQNYEFLQPGVSFLFAENGLSVQGGVTVLVFVLVVSWAWQRWGARVRNAWAGLPAGTQQRIGWGAGLIGFLLLLALPQLLGLFFSDVLLTVGLYVLMGLGLNIVVGFAGLLDLGYVAFFAIGAYTLGVLTSPEVPFELNLIFWVALPIAIAVALSAGIFLGVPVLKVRGDYLAIVTLGFGEIIRLLANSDLLKPWLGDGLGLHAIPKPFIGSFALLGPQQLYYVALTGCLIVLVAAVRLKDSRLGRAWMAIREDEDVAQAMGINLVTTKLLAFAMGACFAGVSGAIFATKLTTIYPVSFNILISVNVLALIIIGGMGSIPGVIVGALALVGLPELLREFADFRLLVYGAVLVVMMLVRPEGLWPEKARQRELHETDPLAVLEGISPAEEVAREGSAG